LYHLIFDGNDIPHGRIIISPDGYYFPFESLVTSYANGTVSYFLENYAVSYAYSARYLLNDFGNDADKAKKLFGIAPVEYKNDTPPALLGSDVSLDKLRSYFSADNLVHEQASKNNFLQKFHFYEIIQLYTHAADSGYNGEPMIWFADSALN